VTGAGSIIPNVKRPGYQFIGIFVLGWGIASLKTMETCKKANNIVFFMKRLLT